MVDHRMKSCSTCGEIYQLVHDCPLKDKKQKPKEDASLSTKVEEAKKEGTRLLKFDAKVRIREGSWKCPDKDKGISLFLLSAQLTD